MTQQPLAERLRPRTLAEYCGQQHIVGAGTPLAAAIAAGQPFSMLLWGEAGCGKTSLALLLADAFTAHFVRLSAVFSGVKEVRSALQTARERRENGEQTLIFIDEIHRFNKAQQDSLLPDVENGTIIFIGATTENPAFHVNRALLSRLRVLRLKPLSAKDILTRLRAANVDADETTLQTLAEQAGGDARQALNHLEQWALLRQQGQTAAAALAQVLAGRPSPLDKLGGQFYHLLSAFHKSLRGSSPDGALYWFAQLIEGGADPLILARRMLCVASEDIGNADPNALTVALNAYQTFERLGAPEGYLALSQAVTYLALAPKSNAAYLAMKAAFAAARQQPTVTVPGHLRNSEREGQYRYAHDEPQAYAAGETYLPPECVGAPFYQPNPRGFEIKLADKLEKLRQLDAAARQ